MAPRSGAWPEQWAISPQKGSFKSVMLGRTSEQENQKETYSETHFKCLEEEREQSKANKTGRTERVVCRAETFI